MLRIDCANKIFIVEYQSYRVAPNYCQAASILNATVCHVDQPVRVIRLFRPISIGKAYCCPEPARQ